mgnify:CR=1 FL=1
MKLALLLIVLSLSGCYTKHQLRKAEDIARSNGCSEKNKEIQEKTERLKKFNQVDSNGNLR